MHARTDLWEPGAGNRPGPPRLKAWRACQHMGILRVDEEGTGTIVHALSGPRGGIQEWNLLEFTKYSKGIDGFKFLRPRSLSSSELQDKIDDLTGSFSLKTPSEIGEGS